MEQDNKILDTILKNTYTKNQALKRLRLLKDFLNFVFFEKTQALSPQLSANSQQSGSLNFESEAVLKSDLEEFRKIVFAKDNPEDLKELDFLAKLDSKFYVGFDHNNLHRQLEELEKQILGVKTVVLYIPFELPTQELEKLGAWFKYNLGVNSLFEITFDPSLIGGCALSLNGAYKDYSLKARINENKDSINKILLGFKGG